MLPNYNLHSVHVHIIIMLHTSKTNIPVSFNISLNRFLGQC